jgi:ferredoxin
MKGGSGQGFGERGAAAQDVGFHLNLAELALEAEGTCPEGAITVLEA